MKVLLISPPYKKDKIFKKSMKVLGAIFPPLGIAYIAAMLEKYGHEVKIIDGPALATVFNYGFKDLEKDIKNFRPDVVGVTASLSQIEFAEKTLRIIKQLSPNTITVIGGPLISVDPTLLLKIEDADYGVYGEADLTFIEILKKIQNKEKLEGSEGLVWRERNKVFFKKPKLIKDLNEIPMPARHLLNMKIYKPSPANYRRLPATTMITSRGCPYQCIFCSKPTEGTAFRAHSAKRVVDEMEHLAKNYGIKDIQIFDDTFTLIPKRVEEVCKEIIKRRLDIWWNCMTRVDKINPYLLRLMKKAGCYEVGFGVESGSERILKFVKKNLTKGQIRQGVKLAKKAGIAIRGFFMIGFPTETKKEIMQTIKFAKELDVDVAQFMVVTPYPGTELWKVAKKHGTISNDWSNFTYYAPKKAPFSSEVLTASEITMLYKRAYKSFYLRPTYILKQFFKIRSLNDVKRNLLAFTGVMGI